MQRLRMPSNPFLLLTLIISPSISIASRSPEPAVARFSLRFSGRLLLNLDAFKYTLFFGAIFGKFIFCAQGVEGSGSRRSSSRDLVSFAIDPCKRACLTKAVRSRASDIFASRCRMRRCLLALVVALEGGLVA